MEKIALVADSTADLDQKTILKYDIKVLRLKVIYEDREYIDGVTISSDEVFKNLDKEVPTTSTPVMSDVHEIFTQLEEEGYTHVIGIHISSNLSGTFNMVNLALKKHPKLQSYVFDSKALSLGAGSLVIACGEMIKEGKTFREITEQLPAMQKKVSVFFVVDTLKYLIKGGRIGRVSGVLGSMLNIKPIIAIDKDGVYYTYEKIRGKKQAVKKLVAIAEETLKNTKAKIWIMQGDALYEGKELLDRFKSLSNVTSLNFGSVGPVLGVHTGPGLLGFVMVKEPFYSK